MSHQKRRRRRAREKSAQFSRAIAIFSHVSRRPRIRVTPEPAPNPHLQAARDSPSSPTRQSPSSPSLSPFLIDALSTTLYLSLSRLSAIDPLCHTRQQGVEIGTRDPVEDPLHGTPGARRCACLAGRGRKGRRGGARRGAPRGRASARPRPFFFCSLTWRGTGGVCHARAPRSANPG